MMRPLLCCALITSLAANVSADDWMASASAEAVPEIAIRDLSTATFSQLGGAGHIRLTGLALDGPAANGIELERFDIFTPDAELIEETADGPRALARPQIALFRTSRADPQVSAFLSVSPVGIYGFARTVATEFVLSTGPANSGLPLLVTNAATLTGPLLVEGAWCAAEGEEWLAAGFQLPRGGAAGAGAYPCQYFRVAVETDNEYLSNLFGGNTTNATNYVATLIGAVAQIYSRDVSTTLQVSFVRLWSTPDPWTETGTGGQLYQFQDYWIANQSGTSRSVAHYLSGRGLGGGVAYLGALCTNSYGYGLSANLNGSFPYPIQNNNGANWDLMVVAHELGHNFGAPHTHSMEPPVDCCGGAYGGSCGGVQNCSGANTGTIMSYCHVCPGGMSNVRMEFHPRTIGETMLPYIASTPCVQALPAVTITDQPDSLFAPSGSPVSFAVVATGPAPLSYQWRRNNVNIGNTANRTGVTTPTLSITAISAADAGGYDCVIMSECGVGATNVATLTVTPAGACPANRGDANCNGVRDFFDIDPFLAALFNQPNYLANYCGGNLCTVDADCNDVVDFFDIDPFLVCLFNGCANCP